MDNVLTDRSPEKLALAVEANLTEFLVTVGHCEGVEVHDEPRMRRGVSDIAFPLFNFTAWIRLAPDEVEAAIEETVTRCREKKVPAVWTTGPYTRPTDLGQRLKARGFHESLQPGMAGDLLELPERSPAPPDLAIERVADLETLETWCRVTTVGFGMPESVADRFYQWLAAQGPDADAPMRHYLGWLGGEPVATSTLFLGAGVAGLYRVATLPEARRQGIGEAITLAALGEGRAAGYQIATLHASRLGAPIYRRLGFREYCTIGRYSLG